MLSRLIVFSALSTAAAFYSSGVAIARGGNTLFYLDNFVIGSSGQAVVAWHVKGSVNGSVTIAAYRKEDWATAKDISCNCDCKLGRAWLNTTDVLGTLPDSTGQFVVQGAPVIDYFYVGLVLCGDTAAADLTWGLHSTFSGTGHAELDDSAVGLPEAYTAAACLAVALLLLTVCQHNWVDASSWGATPSPVKLLALAMGTWALSAALSAAHWLTVLANGVGYPRLEPAARGAEVACRLLLMGTLLLLARGWAVTRNYRRYSDVAGVSVAVLALLGGYIGVCSEYW